jgi:hypothetical protein
MYMYHSKTTVPVMEIIRKLKSTKSDTSIRITAGTRELPFASIQQQ